MGDDIDDINDLDLREEVECERGSLPQELHDWLPAPGDVLIKETSSALRVDPLGYSDPILPEARSQIGRWSLYSEGFLHAGDRLVDGLTGSPAEDELLYPIFYLYRHHLELELKSRVFGCLNRGLSDLEEEDQRGLKNKLVKQHSLRRLWETLKRCYPECDRQYTAATQNAFAQLLGELEDHDPNSQAARYPLDSKDNPTFARLAWVDVRVLRETVRKMSHYLTAIREDMLQELDWRAEMSSW